MSLLTQINKDWTLFLDRDGVINHEKNDSYIFNAEEFVFYHAVPEAIATFARFFKYIFIVTNQRGIGKGLMTEKDLTAIHQKMLAEIERCGGKIDQIYFCPDIASESINRKPNPGMAFQAKKDYPEIDFSKSIMIGNKPSDMKFGKNAGMHTVFVATTHPQTPFPHPDIDERFDNLPAFAQGLQTTFPNYSTF